MLTRVERRTDDHRFAAFTDLRVAEDHRVRRGHRHIGERRIADGLSSISTCAQGSALMLMYPMGGVMVSGLRRRRPSLSDGRGNRARCSPGQVDASRRWSRSGVRRRSEDPIAFEDLELDRRGKLTPPSAGAQPPGRSRYRTTVAVCLLKSVKRTWPRPGVAAARTSGSRVRHHQLQASSPRKSTITVRPALRSDHDARPQPAEPALRERVAR